jgi:hypothetical protein
MDETSEAISPPFVQESVLPESLTVRWTVNANGFSIGNRQSNADLLFEVSSCNRHRKSAIADGAMIPWPETVASG